MVFRASSSTGFNRGRGSIHGYARTDRPIPLPTMHRWQKGGQAKGLPIDPRIALPGQLFLSARPRLVGVADPVPESLRVFVLPGFQRCVRDIDWHEFDGALAVREGHEQCARLAGAELGWRAVLARYLGDGDGRLGFFQPLSVALGYAARSAESADEIVGAVHEIVIAHPDCNADRRGQYTQLWLRRELSRLRSKDAARDPRIDAEINAIRGRFRGMGLW
jgi:hypothetical protein